MAVKSKIPYQDGIYLITYTCYNWIPLIEITKGYDIIYKGFDYLTSQGHFINGYVIMPNHVHALIAFRNHGENLNTLIGATKRFSAYEIAERLKFMAKNSLLAKLIAGVPLNEKKKGKLHHVWTKSFDWQICDSTNEIERVLDYIHHNPCAGKWKLVENAFEYPHSSAKFYLTGEQGIYPVTNYMNLEDIDLTQTSSLHRNFDFLSQ